MLSLCVLLWSVEGREDDLADYEDRVLALLPAPGGRLISRVRAVEDGPTEVLRVEVVQAHRMGTA